MADKDAKTTNDPASAEPAAPKRPHATLDLKATEIKVTTIGEKTDTAKTPGPAPAATYSEAAKPTAGAGAKENRSTASKPTASTAEKATSEASSPAAPEKIVVQKRGGMLTHLAAGVMGGVLALAGSEWALTQLGVDGASSRLSDATSAISQRLSALEKKAPSTSSEVEQRFAILEKSSATIPNLTAAQSRLAADTKAALAAAASDAGEPEQLTRLGALEDKLKALSDAGANDPNAGRLPQLAALTGKVADLETSLATQLTALRKSVAEDVEGRIQSATEVSEAAKSGAQRIDKDVASVKGDAIRIEERIVAIKSELDRTAAAAKLAQEEAASLKADLGAFKSTTAKPADVTAAIAPLSERLAGLDIALQTVAKSEADRKATSERIVLSLELQHLKRALDSGRAYQVELDAVARSAGGMLDLAQLDEFKATGVPPTAELAKEFRTVANAAIDAEIAPAEGSVVDKLIAGAKSVVRVRKVNHTPDDKSAEAIVGRIEIALNADRPEDALNEAKDLPPKSQAAAKPFLDKVAARVSVQVAMSALETRLKSSLAPADTPTTKPQ